MFLLITDLILELQIIAVKMYLCRK